MVSECQSEPFIQEMAKAVMQFPSISEKVYCVQIFLGIAISPKDVWRIDSGRVAQGDVTAGAFYIKIKFLYAISNGYNRGILRYGLPLCKVVRAIFRDRSDKCTCLNETMRRFGIWCASIRQNRLAHSIRLNSEAVRTGCEGSLLDPAFGKGLTRSKRY